MKRIFYLVFVFIFSIAILSAKAQTGVYKVTGYVFDIGNNNRPINLFKEITATSDGKLLASVAGDYSNSVKFSFRIDSGNQLTDWAGISINPFDTAGSFYSRTTRPVQLFTREKLLVLLALLTTIHMIRCPILSLFIMDFTIMAAVSPIRM